MRQHLSTLVYVAFWDKAVRDAEFAAEQRVWIENALTTISNVIVARTNKTAHARQLAMELISLVQGISIQRIFDPDSWSRENIEAVVRRRAQEIDLE